MLYFFKPNERWHCFFVIFYNHNLFVQSWAVKQVNDSVFFLVINFCLQTMHLFLFSISTSLCTKPSCATDRSGQATQDVYKQMYHGESQEEEATYFPAVNVCQ